MMLVSYSIDLVGKQCKHKFHKYIFSDTDGSKYQILGILCLHTESFNQSVFVFN